MNQQATPASTWQIWSICGRSRSTDPASGRLRGLRWTPARVGLRAEGCAVLDGFVRPEAVVRLNDEIVERKHATHYSTQVMNPVLPHRVQRRLPGRPSGEHLHRALQRLHPRRRLGCGLRHRRAVPCAGGGPVHRRLPGDSRPVLLRRSRWPGSRPTSAIRASSSPGTSTPTDFAVTVLVQPADEGGLFEYVPQIRSAEDEGFEAIAAVLAGGQDGVRTLDLRPRRPADLPWPPLAAPGHPGRRGLPAPPRRHLRLHPRTRSDRPGRAHPPTLRPSPPRPRASRTPTSPLRPPPRLTVLPAPTDSGRSHRISSANRVFFAAADCSICVAQIAHFQVGWARVTPWWNAIRGSWSTSSARNCWPSSRRCCWWGRVAAASPHSAAMFAETTVDLSVPGPRRAAREDPDGVLAACEGTTVIDEWQEAARDSGRGQARRRR